MSDLSQAFDSFTNAMINAANVAIAADTSKKDRKFAEKMYNKQVEDNRKNWEMQNAYNHPRQQMIRLTESGLNPHLVYGTGAVGNSASVPAGSSLPSYHSTMVPQFQAMQLGQLYLQNQALAKDIEGKELDNDNKRLAYLKESENAQYYKEIADINFEILNSKRNVQFIDESIKQYEAYLNNLRNDWTHYYNHDYPSFCYDDNGNLVEERVNRFNDKVKKQLEGLIGQNFAAEMKLRPAELNNVIKKTDILVEELKLYPAKLRSMEANAAYDELKLSLAQNGININDPMWARILGRILNELFPEGAIHEGVETLKSWLPWNW